MRVLHIASWYPVGAEDIAGVFVREHVRCLAGHVEQHVVTTVQKEAPAPTQEPGFALTQLQIRHRRGSWLVPYVAAVTEASRAVGPDLIHAHITRPAGVAARWAARSLGVPYVVTEHTGPFAALFDTHILNRAAARWALRGAAVVTAVTGRHAIEISQAVHGISPVVVSNTVNTHRFSAPARRSSADPRIIFLGRLDRQKGCDLLLRALIAPDLASRPWRLVVAGSGPEEADLRRMAGALGDRVVFLGPVSPPRVPALLTEADLLVLPSRGESFGVVLIEALAAGVPVLATRCGGPEEIVTEDVGHLVAAGDVDELAEGLKWMLARYPTFDPASLRASAERRFGYEAVARQFLGVYARALEGATN